MDWLDLMATSCRGSFYLCAVTFHLGAGDQNSGWCRSTLPFEQAPQPMTVSSYSSCDRILYCLWSTVVSLAPVFILNTGLEVELLAQVLSVVF